MGSRELGEIKGAGITEDAKKTISQLESLHAHCMCMRGKEEEGEIWEADCKAIEIAIKAIRRQYMDNRAEKQGKGLRLYLSGPISGTDDYIKRFDEVEDRLTEEGYSVINPARLLERLPGGFSHEEYMGVCMGLLAACDAICMLGGWEGSTGANREYGFALARGMGIYK